MRGDTIRQTGVAVLSIGILLSVGGLLMETGAIAAVSEAITPPAPPKMIDRSVEARVGTLSAGVDGTVSPNEQMAYWARGIGSYWHKFDPDSIPRIKRGKTFYFNFEWINTGSEGFRGHISVTVTKPSGKKVEAPAGTPYGYNNNDNYAEPGDGKTVTFHWTLDEKGTYTAKAVLTETGKSEVLDTWEGPVVKTKEVPTKTFKLTTKTDPSEGGTINVQPSSDDLTYEAGTTVKLFANSRPGWKFVRWSPNVEVPDPEYPKHGSITMNSDKTVTAYFVSYENMCKVTTSIEPQEASKFGSVTTQSLKTRFPAGEEVTVEATEYAPKKWFFDHWSGDLSGTSNPLTFTITEDTEAVAVFKENTYEPYVDLTIEINPKPAAGEIDGPGAGTYKRGKEITLDADPSRGWAFLKWGGDLSGSEDPKTITLREDTHVEAFFVREKNMAELTLTTDPPDGGSIKVIEGQRVVRKGTTVRIQAFPNNNYEFSHWKGAISTKQNPTSIYMSEDMAVCAVFKKKRGVTMGLAMLIAGLVMVPVGLSMWLKPRWF